MDKKKLKKFFIFLGVGIVIFTAVLCIHNYCGEKAKKPVLLVSNVILLSGIYFLFNSKRKEKRVRRLEEQGVKRGYAYKPSDMNKKQGLIKSAEKDYALGLILTSIGIAFNIAVMLFFG